MGYSCSKFLTLRYSTQSAMILLQPATTAGPHAPDGDIRQQTLVILEYTNLPHRGTQYPVEKILDAADHDAREVGGEEGADLAPDRRGEAIAAARRAGPREEGASTLGD
jgi:hypothetical protein